MKKYLFVIPLIVLLSSCMGLTYITTPQTVALSQGNFKFVRTVKVETKAWYVFGIGGFEDRATEDVIEKLRVRAELQPNQALADIRVKTTNKYYLGIVIKRTLTAAATVVEFKDSGTNTFAVPKKENNVLFEKSQSEIKDQEFKAIFEIEKNKKNNSDIVVYESNKIEEENIEITSKDIESLSTRELEYLRLRKIRGTLKKGNVGNMLEIKAEVERINEWYNSIHDIYPEIHNILKEIKSLL